MSALPPAPPAVYSAIVAVMADLAATGIAKERDNKQQGYKFRGVEDIYNALAPLLAKHKLAILPRVLSRTCDERQSKSGGALFYVAVDVEYDLIGAVDGSKHTVRTAGEAMDSADKATNKAMSAAYKYMAFQTFCIPVEGTEDADAVSHDVAPRSAPRGEPEPKAPHHESWAKDHKRFCAAIPTIVALNGAKYEDVAAWCDAEGWKRPSTWTQADRDTFLADLTSNAGVQAKFLSFHSSQLPAK